jgi:Spy/CpxP family protein refolding chaperone
MRTRWLTFVLKSTSVALVACALVLLAAIAHAQNKFVMDDNQFNGWLFQGTGQIPDKDSEVTLMVEAMDRSCHLTAEQKNKLRLAGHGDYARFDQKVNDLRSECVGKTYNQDEINELYQKFQPLTAQYQAGMLGSTSLFAKVVQGVLTPEQREEFEAAEAERRKTRHAAKVRLFVAILEQSCPLKSSQRDAMVELLLKETQPALRSSQYDWYVVVVQAAKIPDSKWKPILDQAQMTYVKKITGQARGMEATLRQMGVLPRR